MLFILPGVIRPFGWCGFIGEMVFDVNCDHLQMDGCWWCGNMVVMMMVVVMIYTHNDEGYGTVNCLLQLFTLVTSSTNAHMKAVLLPHFCSLLW